MELFIYTVLPQNYKSLDINIEYNNLDFDEHEFILMVDFYVQKYRYSKTVRIIICNSVTGEIDGQACKSKFIVLFSKLFQ